MSPWKVVENLHPFVGALQLTDYAWTALRWRRMSVNVPVSAKTGTWRVPAT